MCLDFYLYVQVIYCNKTFFSTSKGRSNVIVLIFAKVGYNFCNAQLKLFKNYPKTLSMLPKQRNFAKSVHAVGDRTWGYQGTMISAFVTLTKTSQPAFLGYNLTCMFFNFRLFSFSDSPGNSGSDRQSASMLTQVRFSIFNQSSYD